MLVVKKVNVNFDSCVDYRARIAVIDQAIDDLLPFLMEKMLNSDMVEYSLNTGQSTQTVKLKTNEDFTAAIGNLRKLRQLFVSDLNEREGNNIVQLQDSSNFRFPWGC